MIHQFTSRFTRLDAFTKSVKDARIRTTSLSELLTHIKVRKEHISLTNATMNNNRCTQMNLLTSHLLKASYKCLYLSCLPASHQGRAHDDFSRGPTVNTISTIMLTLGPQSRCPDQATVIMNVNRRHTLHFQARLPCLLCRDNRGRLTPHAIMITRRCASIVPNGQD